MNNSLYTPLGSSIQCNLCFRHCAISNGKIGFCGVNINSDGVLRSLVYGIPSAVQVDPIEKKPLFHFYPGSDIYSIGTVGCNFRCPFCQNAHLAFEMPRSPRPISIEKILTAVHKSGCKSIAFTYNEPTVAWLWYRDIAAIAKAEGLSTVMVTNGCMSEEVCQEMIDRIDAVNIDLKSFDQIGYGKLKGNLTRVLENIQRLDNANVWVELTTLIVPTISDSQTALDEMAHSISKTIGTKIPWHLSSYHCAHHFSEPPLSHEAITARCEQLREKGFSFVYEGNTTATNTTLCPHCATALIERHGYTTILHLERGTCPTCGRVLEGRFI